MAPDDPTQGQEQGTQGGDEPLITAEFLAGLGLSLDSGNDGDGEIPPPNSDQPPPEQNPDPPATEEYEELRAAARKAGEEEGFLRAQRELAEKTAKAEAERKRTDEYKAFEQKYKERIGTFRDPDFASKFLQANTGAEVQDLLTEVAEQFNAHHADGLKLYEDEAIASVTQDYTSQLFDGIGTVLGDEAKTAILEAHEKRDNPTWGDFIGDIVEAARKDALTQAKAAELVQTAISKIGRDEKWLRAQLSRVTSPSGRSGGNASPSGDSAIIDAYARGEPVDAKAVKEALARINDTPIVI